MIFLVVHVRLIQESVGPLCHVIGTDLCNDLCEMICIGEFNKCDKDPCIFRSASTLGVHGRGDRRDAIIRPLYIQFQYDNMNKLGK
jgi:hypothetical protein